MNQGYRGADVLMSAIRMKFVMCLIISMVVVNGWSQSDLGIKDEAHIHKEIDRLLNESRRYLGVKYDSCFNRVLKAMDLARQINNFEAIEEANQIVGDLYVNSFDWPTEKERKVLSQQITRQLNSNQTLGQVLFGLAEDYHLFKQKKTTLETMQMAIDVAKFQDDYRFETKAMKRMAEFYFDYGDTLLCMSLFGQALNVSKLHNDSVSIVSVLNNRAKLLFEVHDYSASFTDYQLALTYTALNQDVLRCESLLGLARSSVFLKQPDKVIEYIKLAQSTKGLRDIQMRMALHLVWSDYYEAENNSLAYTHFKLYSQIRDSASFEERLDFVNRIRIYLNSGKTEKEIDGIRQEVEVERIKRRTFLIVAMIVGVLIVLSIIGIRNRNKILKRENEISRERIRMDQERLKNIEERNQIEHEKAENRKQLELIEREQLRQNLERAEIERRELAIELDEKHRTLLTNSMQNEQYNDFLNELLTDLKIISDVVDKSPGRKLLNQLTNRVQSQLNQADDWDKTKLYFEKVHPHFFEKLKSDYPDLSVNELKMCAYTKMNLNGKEISRLLNINPNSVQVARYRLKRKMNLPEAVNFTDFISQNY